VEKVAVMRPLVGAKRMIRADGKPQAESKFRAGNAGALTGQPRIVILRG